VKRTIIAAAVALLAAGCGGNAKQAAAPTTVSMTTTTTVPETPEDAFLATVKQAGLGDTDMNDPSNLDALVGIGHDICQIFDDGGDYGMAAEAAIGAKQRHPNGEQVKTLITAAVINFCPRHTADLPNG
jgi:Protein of unknown function (DUF732)